MMEFKTMTYEELVREAYRVLIVDFCRVDGELKKFKDDEELLAERILVGARLNELSFFLSALDGRQFESDGLILKKRGVENGR